MAKQPIIFALSNPVPEIWPQDVLSVRPDAYVGTGRSDLPNQVNNVLCFPYIFRGAMDAGAGCIDLAMKKACVQALSRLAKKGFVDCIGTYHFEIQEFSPTYFIPKPFDLRLGIDLPLAVAEAAVASGQARPFNLEYYRKCLIQRAYCDFFVFKTLLSQTPKPDSQLPILCYIIETQDNRLPHAVHAAARLMQTHGLANVQFVGNHEVIRDQLAKDSVLSAAPVMPHMAPVQNRGASFQSTAYVRIVSGTTHQEGCVQGWIYQDTLHLYGPEKPADHMIKMLQACGCVFRDGYQPMVGDPEEAWQALACQEPEMSHSDRTVVAQSSLGVFDGAEPPQGQPHFGGLKPKNTLPAVWHTGASPSFFGNPWFGPMVLGPQDVPSISDRDTLRCVLEHSSWALLMQTLLTQEITM
jgi:hypothetical protein